MGRKIIETAEDREKIIKGIIRSIKVHKTEFFDDIWLDYTRISRGTAYKHKFNENDAIQEALEENRKRLKKSMREGWRSSPNATLQLAAYKLIATPEEKETLSTTNVKADMKADVDSKVTLVTFKRSE